MTGLPDGARGERVCAVVEQPCGAAPISLREAVNHRCGHGLSPHELPEQWEIVAALPRNEALRKVLKYKLKEQFTE